MPDLSNLIKQSITPTPGAAIQHAEAGAELKIAQAETAEQVETQVSLKEDM
ncbi:MAG: hypothetical protein JSR46_08695, partial [Verrucomicrobia bacterium]|nr:hypothetical protein [Verrucomicrobiota bacterium]